MVELKYGEKALRLPRDCIELKDLSNLFKLEKEGLHIKYQDTNASWMNCFPSNGGKFILPTGCFTAHVIGIPKDVLSQEPSSSFSTQIVTSSS